MKKNTVFVLICSLFLTMQGLFGQTNGGAIEGTVSDKETGEKLPGASVYIKSLERGQAADEQGRFAFRDLASGEYILQVSFMGYHLQEIPVLVTPNEPARIQIHLDPEATSLSEIAVTAKSEARQRKEEGMPVTVVNMSSLQGTVSNISDILSKTVGMTIRVSGGVGSASRVSVRGLEGKRIGFFIDEVPMNDQSDFIDLNDIPVDMIERIEIYKGIVPARFGGSAMGGAVNIVIKEYPDRYMDASYMLESFNSNKAQLVAKRNLKEQGILFGFGGAYTYADNDYVMNSPYVDGLKIKRNHDRFKKILMGGSFKATKWWFDEVEFEPAFVQTAKQIQGIKTDIRKAETNSRAYMFANSLKKDNFFLDGFDFDLSTAVAFTQINLIDTARQYYDWDGVAYNAYGGELGTNYRSNSDDWKLTVLNKLNLQYYINTHHSLNFNSVFNLANGYPSDSVRDQSFGRQTVFDSKMKSWVGGINHDYRSANDKLLNSLTVRYYVYSMKTRKAPSYGSGDIKDINLLKKDIGFSNAMRYKFTRDLMAKFSAGYDVRIPAENELLGDGHAVLPADSLYPERNVSLNLGLLYNRMGMASDNLQLEVNFFYMHLRDMIRYVKGFVEAQYQNFGEMRTFGVELDAKGDLTPWLYGYANATFQDLRDMRKLDPNSSIENPTKGMRMPNIPYLMGNAGLEYHKANLFGGKGQNTRLFADMSFIEEYYYDFEMTLLEKRRIPRSVTFDLGFEQSFLHNRLFVSGKIKNLTDANLLTEFNRPLPGRSLGMKIRYIFN